MILHTPNKETDTKYDVISEQFTIKIGAPVMFEVSGISEIRAGFSEVLRGPSGGFNWSFEQPNVFSVLAEKCEHPSTYEKVPVKCRVFVVVKVKNRDKLKIRILK